MDVAIVGAGIMGLAHAWCASERGHRVRVFERSRRAEGASIRNFGMIWPIGQAPGEALELALRGREGWLRLGEEAGISVRRCGSIVLAHRDDEWAVLQEFADRATGRGYECELLTPAAVTARTPAANPDGLRGGLLSATELGVSPPRAIAGLARWLAEARGVAFQFETTVVGIDGGRLASADGQSWCFDRAVVCGGADLATLFPSELGRGGLVRCKLQMLATRPQGAGWRLGPHLASGLSLRHYRSFDGCPTLPALRSRVATETPDLDRFGIHVMASQDEDGRVILGDSHEYGDEVDPFDKEEVEALIVRELRRVLVLPDWSNERRWHGVYVKDPAAICFAAEPLPGVSLRTGVGGGGMTLAFGLAERDWERWGSA